MLKKIAGTQIQWIALLVGCWWLIPYSLSNKSTFLMAFWGGVDVQRWERKLVDWICRLRTLSRTNPMHNLAIIPGCVKEFGDKNIGGEPKPYFFISFIFLKKTIKINDG